MKKKINRQMLHLAVVAIVATLFTITAIFYSLLKDQIFDDLQAYTLLLQNGDSDIIKNDSIRISDTDVLRITIVHPSGEVLFDNMADSSDMTNHRERPEIQDALEKGKGRAIRKSQTLSKNTYYYAVRMSDGNVLRVAKESGNALHILWRAVPILIVVFLLLLFMCILFSNHLTKSIIQPIEKMACDMDHMDQVESYPELQPFIQTIHEQHKDILKSANMRQEFTANVSHELKTPLTSISGYSELIENGMVSEKEAIRFAKEIHRNANRLLTLINDIIRLSQLDTPQESTAFEQVDLYALADTCVEMLQMNAQRHKVTISMKGERKVVYGSRQMLEELLYNLCDNAIRYNKENGSVVVTVDEEDDNVFLSVKDTGIGIGSQHQERIFERFYRVDKSRSKQTGGTGLGLAIVKHIVALHRAEITLESEAGKGTEIKVIFV